MLLKVSKNISIQIIIQKDSLLNNIFRNKFLNNYLTQIFIIILI